MRPLEGYKVVDLTTFVAAPVCARLLSDMGADVVKVEPPKGDAWRQSGVGFLPTRFTQEENPIFDIYNTGKKLVCLNLKTEEGMEAMQKLLSEADVFITNNRPAALKRLGLDYETLHEKFPKLVYGIVLGYGEKGPDADKQAFDTTAFWTRSGFLRDTSLVHEMYQPVSAPSGVGDSYTGTNLAMQVLAALMLRDKTGMGQCVRASLFQVGMFAMGSMTLMTQRPFGKQMPQNRPDSKPAGGPFQCSDGEWVFISAGMPLILEMIKKPELIDDPRFSMATRWQNREFVYETLKEGFLNVTSDEVMAYLADKDTPSVRMSHFADVSEDEQAWANGYLERVEYPNGNSNVFPASPFGMDLLTPPKTQPTKRLGQDTVSVLKDLGYTDQQIEAMLQSGAILG